MLVRVAASAREVRAHTRACSLEPKARLQGALRAAERKLFLRLSKAWSPGARGQGAPFAPAQATGSAKRGR